MTRDKGNCRTLESVAKVNLGYINTLGDFRNISTISIFLLAVAPYNFYNFDTKMV